MRSRRFTAALVGVAALHLLGCQDVTRPVSLDVDTNTVALHRYHAPPQAITLGAPLFGLDARPEGGLLAAVASAGVIRIDDNSVEPFADLPGINDVVSFGRREAFAITGGSEDPTQILPTSRQLFHVSDGSTRLVADLWEFEQAVNPDGFWHTGEGAVLSNPFDIALLRHGRLLIADAAANDILLVKPNGKVDWVAVLTPVSPGGPEPVPTSIAVGPEGDYYVGELTGFPGTAGLSRIWRIARGSRHVVCPSARCKLVATGFTSIMDLTFGHDGTLYVVEFDEAGWLGVEQKGFERTPAGGTVNACNVRNGRCSVVKEGLSLPTAIAVDRKGILWVAEHPSMLFAGAQVQPLCETKGGYSHGRRKGSLPSCRRLVP
jgi:hypothetical protein